VEPASEDEADDGGPDCALALLPPPQPARGNADATSAMAKVTDARCVKVLPDARTTRERPFLGRGRGSTISVERFRCLSRARRCRDR